MAPAREAWRFFGLYPSLSLLLLLLDFRSFLDMMMIPPFEVSCCAPDRFDRHSCLYSISVSLLACYLNHMEIYLIHSSLFFLQVHCYKQRVRAYQPWFKVTCFFFHVSSDTYSDTAEEIFYLRYKEYKLNDYSSWFLKQVCIIM